MKGKKRIIKNIKSYRDIRTRLDSIDFIISNSDISSYRSSEDAADNRIADIILMRINGLSIAEMANLIHNKSTGLDGISEDRAKQNIAKAARDLKRKIENPTVDSELCPRWKIKKLSEICRSIAVN